MSTFLLDEKKRVAFKSPGGYNGITKSTKDGYNYG
jgi:hypothetical protein